MAKCLQGKNTVFLFADGFRAEYSPSTVYQPTSVTHIAVLLIGA